MLYDIFFIIFSLFYLPYFLVSGKWRGFSRQRFGDFDEKTASLLKDIGRTRPIWIHAVSVGEVMATVPLYEEIRKSYPDKKIIISTVTQTGNRIAAEKFKEASAIIYLPLDLSPITDKVAGLVNPGTLLIAETEIWPNFITSLKKIGAKIAIFNGRLSPGSFKNYGIVRPLVKGLLQKVDLFLMQSQADADKVISLGAPQETVKVTGNLKYDAELSRAGAKDAASVRRDLCLSGAERLLIAGSTHPGEEEKILCCYEILRWLKQRKPESPEIRLLIAPRHTNRAGAVAGLVKAHGLKPRFVSKLGADGFKEDEVVILDVMGRLAELYAAADIVFIGGSLIRKGGQNPLEAAYHSKPVIFGPHMHNFKEIAENLLSGGAAQKVEGATDELANAIVNILADESRQKSMGENARRVLESNAGAAARDLALIAPLIKR